MRTDLLNRAGDVRNPVEVNPATRHRRHPREKDRHRGGKWVPRLAAADAFSPAQRTTSHRKSMALFGIFRGRARTHGWRRSELLGRENTYGQKFGSPRRTLIRNRFGETGFRPIPGATNHVVFHSVRQFCRIYPTETLPHAFGRVSPVGDLRSPVFGSRQPAQIIESP